MRARPLGFWSSISLVVTLGACSNIIGISGIEIDPSLDGGSGGKASEGGSAGGPSHGGKPATAGDTSMPEGGDPTTAGTSAGGKNVGGDETGGKSSGASGGSGAMGGEGGEGGEPPIVNGMCQSAQECDDTIDCTVDTCADHKCVHTANATLCDPHNCETCKVGIGCVAGEKATQQVLLDPNFDTKAPDGWDETESEVANILADAMAISAPNSVKIGPAAPTAKSKLYSDVYQPITLPDNLVSLSLSLNYKFLAGNRNMGLEYVSASLYEVGEVDPFTQFHKFAGTATAQTTWKSATYSAPQSEVDAMSGKEFTFDLVANSWDATYYFDNLELNATYCK